MEPDLATARDSVAEVLGLWVEDSRLSELGRVLEARRRAVGAADLPAYLAELPRGSRVGAAERRSLADQLTTCESYFFRNAPHMVELAERIVPELLQASEPLRILSAGCSRGEEPYTLAMLLDELLVAPLRFRLEALDISPRALATAREGLYHPRSLRSLSAARRARYFRAERGRWRLAAPIRDAVRFRELNLGTGETSPLPGSPFHLILCRNVLMYLRADRAASALARLEASLALGGYLFLGHAETVRGLSDRSQLELVEATDTFYYHHPRRPAACPPPEPAAPPVLAPPWPEIIAGAQRRIESLAASVTAVRPDTRLAATSRAPGEVLAEAAELYQQGRLDAAAELAETVVSGPEPHAWAYLLRGLCAAAREDLLVARQALKAAIFLDPECAIAHLHLGTTLRRLGEVESSARSLRRARLLLPREDPACLDSFAGSLGREGLGKLALATLLEVEAKAS